MDKPEHEGVLVPPGDRGKRAARPASVPEARGDAGLVPPERRNWRARLFTSTLHFGLLFVRAMTVGVRAACFDDKGRIFLVRHTYVAGWHMPGGGVERHETVRAALSKELEEEGRLIILGEPELVGVYYNRRTSRRDHVVFYRCLVRQTGPRPPDREIAETGFFDLDNLPEGTTGATLRRLAELKGQKPKDELW